MTYYCVNSWETRDHNNWFRHQLAALLVSFIYFGNFTFLRIVIKRKYVIFFRVISGLILLTDGEIIRGLECKNAVYHYTTTFKIKSVKGKQMHLPSPFFMFLTWRVLFMSIQDICCLRMPTIIQTSYSVVWVFGSNKCWAYFKAKFK